MKSEVVLPGLEDGPAKEVGEAGADPSPISVAETEEEATGKQTRRAWRWWLLLSIVLLLGAAAAVSWKFQLYRPLLNRYNAAAVTLKVREGDTFALADAKVEVNGATYQTDANGKVSLPSLVAGTYSVTVEKDGYLPSTVSLALHRGDNDLQYISLTKQPEKLYSVKGFVKDYVSDQPLVNVQVTLGSKTVATDPSGEYAFTGVAAGQVQLQLSKAGYLDRSFTASLDKGDLLTASLPMTPVGQVIFVSNRDGKRRLYSSTYDGASQHLFVQPVGASEDFAPALSPSGKSVAFSSTRDGVKDQYSSDLVKLYVVGADGKGLAKVSDDLTPSFAPLWDPTGRRLFFSGFSDAKLTTPTFRVYDLAKGSSVDLGEVANSPVFSPDGSILAYSTPSTEAVAPSPSAAPSASPSPTTTPAPAEGVSTNVLRTFNLQTGERKSLGRHSQYMSDLRFSPDGKTVSYEVIADGVRHRYADSLADGSESEVAVLPFSKRQYQPSPDGQKQVFVEERDGKTDLFLVDKNGNNEKRLTTLGVLDDQYLPVWDPSSTYLVVAVKREAENALYVVSIAGGDAKKVSDYYVQKY